ncbi:MAG: heparinase II/III family protein, partial [Oscillospiraceae bacterium]|nr:heparinase II/III family protein [Oscillospiraceae bacterium]
ILEDSQLIGMLSERAEKMELENDKSGSLKIWENWEKGILLATFDMLRDGRISGNFGQAQGVASLAAIVLDKQPETDEILKWVYATNTGASKSDITGGDIDYTLINRVDRDGMGDEASPRYNASWVTNLNTFASALKMYKGNLGFNPYTNPKFVKMLDPQMNLVLLGTKHPSIGDAGAPAATDFFGGSSAWEDAFVSVENENYKKKLAQYIYKLHGGDLSDLRYGIFAENPEAAEEDVMKYVTEGEQLPSDMLTGYGFAVLRDGESYKSASTGTESNTSRDFWMWFGRTPASHAHRDLLNLGIDAFGLDVAPDLGYPEDTSYTPNRLQWVQATLSHNTVVVNEKDQRQPKGFVSATPLHFDDSGKVKVMDIDADEAYSEVDDYRRTVVMVEASDDVSYGVDFFRVTGGDSHTYSFHSQAEKAYPVSGLDGLTPDPVVQDENGKDIIGSYAGADVPYGQDPNTQDNYDYETFYPRGYTWLKNVRRDKAPEAKFTVEFDVQDYRKILTNGKGIKLRMTQLNNFTADEVAIAGGYMTVKSETKMMPETWDYVLVQRKKNGEEKLDSLFTTVYEPYRDTPYIQGIEEVGAVVKNGEEKPEDMVRALKVSRVSNGKLHTDYIVYATNNKVTYIVDGKFDFAGFVGVYTLNANDAVIYRYINHGSLIGEDSGKVAEYSGTVNAFEKDLAFENYIDVKMKCDDLSDLVNRYIYINNDGVENGAYKIISATDNAEGLAEGCIRLDIGTVTLIRSYVDKNDADRGYVYNIKEGQSFTIPTSFADESVPEFDEVQENISTSASSSVSVTLHATSPIKENPPIITYIGTTLPRGASLNSETGVFTWKPDNSQVGDNHVAITALDSDGRESTVHFTVTVYGSTTGSSSSEKTETPSTDNTDTPAGG